mmetsp:Transcript_13035/g.24265  ORF Transcript_13035/g.24265 Transcript_13035/m.24265 type:complete len:325 (+) Transcript_13035:278-1252(+)
MLTSLVNVERNYPTKPTKILDAPDVLDDYCLNLMAWSEQHLAVSLGKSVYLWDVSAETTKQPYEGSAHITAISWQAGGRVLAIGDKVHCIHLLDIETETVLRTISCHTGRVTSLAWNGSILSSGSSDCSIVHNDYRLKNYSVKCTGHDRDVVALAWSSDGNSLASGGKEGSTCLWEIGGQTPRAVLNEHNECVKGVAWCPWERNLLATGAADEQIRLWNTDTLRCTASADTGSQVSSLLWSKHTHELLSSHGFDRYHLALWSIPDFSLKAEFMGHSSRVLGLASNESGSLVASLGADETLCFWEIFESDSKSEASKPSPEFKCR